MVPCIIARHDSPNQSRTRGFLILAAVPLALQIAAEARQAAAPAGRRPVRRSTSKPACVRCWPPTATTATPTSGWAACGSTRAKVCSQAASRAPRIVPGDPDKSLLIEAVRQTRETLKMPKGGRLKPAEIEALAEWVKAGALWPSFAAGSSTTELAGRFGG